MTGSVDTGLGSVNTAAQPAANPGTGTGDVDSVTGLPGNPVVVNNADPANPVVSGTVFAGTPTPVGTAGPGAAASFALGDHAHAILTTATATTMAALVVTTMPDGTPVYVTARDAVFRLVTSTRAVNTWDTFASATAGRQWHRVDAQSLKYAEQATWSVDPQNSTGLASDDNTGVDDAHPLRSFSEWAYRWGACEISTFVAGRMLSDQNAADVPHWRYQLATANGFVLLSGIPTTLFTGTLTGAAQASNVAATADDNTVACAGLAVSFTASGGLAKGVLYKRTNSTALYWFALKETVAKTIRISRPMNAAASASGFPAVNDTFAALRLPRLGAHKFDGVEQWKMFIEFVDDRGAYSDGVALPVFFTHTYVSVARFENDLAWTGNRCINAPGFSMSKGPGTAAHINPSFIGTGATTYAAAGVNQQWTGGIYMQGCWFNANANAQVAGTSTTGAHVYDCTTDAFRADYWSFILLGFVSGTGNTSNLLVATKWSQIAYFVAPGTVAGSTTDATPIVAGVTQVAAGTDIPLNVNGNGVYITI